MGEVKTYEVVPGPAPGNHLTTLMTQLCNLFNLHKQSGMELVFRHGMNFNPAHGQYHYTDITLEYRQQGWSYGGGYGRPMKKVEIIQSVGVPHVHVLRFMGVQFGPTSPVHSNTLHHDREIENQSLAMAIAEWLAS
jgi:hypothetical protein